MFSKLTIKREDHESEVTALVLAGGITEKNGLRALTQCHPILILNTKYILHINSFGAQKWVEWIHSLGRKSKLYLVECSPVFVLQLNLVTDFIGQAEVLSFYLPYFCPTCDIDDEVLVSKTQARTVKRQPPICIHCKSPMTFDGDSRMYFSFLDHAESTEVREGSILYTALKSFSPQTARLILQDLQLD